MTLRNHQPKEKIGSFLADTIYKCLVCSNEHAENLLGIENKVSLSGTANEKGSGLGLILCKEFVEKHGGRIWVESEVGKGSAFKFSLPLS